VLHVLNFHLILINLDDLELALGAGLQGLVAENGLGQERGFPAFVGVFFFVNSWL
jgi:hypothetical protein